jgi:hypothetical protein
MNIGKLLNAIIKTAKANPSLVISAVTAIGPIVKAVKAEAKKPKV